MGESKHKPTLIGLEKPVSTPKRPAEALFRLKMAVEASKGSLMDDDSAEFMADLETAMGWLGYLETQQGQDLDQAPALVVFLRSERGVFGRKVGPEVLQGLLPEGWGPILEARLADLMVEAGINPVAER